MAIRKKATRRGARPVRRPATAKTGRPNAAAKRATAASRAKTGRSKAPTRPRAVPVTPNAIGATRMHLDYTTHDPAAVRRFYEGTLGLPARVDETHGSLTIEVSSGATLGFMPPKPGPPEQWRPPREPGLHVEVADVDAAYRRLAARGVTFEQPPLDMSWGARACRLRDPEGRIVWLAQVIHRRP